jgi:hypothetical protein
MYELPASRWFRFVLPANFCFHFYLAGEFERSKYGEFYYAFGQLMLPVTAN